MTPVGDYLKKLLYQYDCLVVPELGAFLTHYRPASFTEATGQYLPPRKQLAFNEALRLDDGILTNYLMLHESITRDAALRRISQFVAEIRQQIRTAGSFTLEGIGLLTLNDENKLQFDPELRHNFFGESFGFQPLQAEYCEPTAVSLPVSVLPPMPSQSLALVDHLANPEGKLMPMPVTRRSPWYWAAATLLIGSLAALSYMSVWQPNQPLESSLNPASLLRMPTFAPREAVASDVVNRPVATELAPAKPIAISRVIPIAEPLETPTATVKATPASTEAVAEVKRSVAKPTVVKPVVEVAKKAANPEVVKPFMVVAGSFSSRDNALRLRRKLLQAGFSDTYLMMPTRAKELIKVAAYGAVTRAEADTIMVKVTELTGVPAWLMRTR